MPPPSSRMTKNRPQPTRYRPGKAEVEDQESEEESSEDEQEHEVQAKAPPPKATTFPAHKKLAVDLSKADSQRTAAPVKPPDQDLEGFVTASESSDEDDGDDSDSAAGGSDQESSAEEDSSSDDEPKKPMLAPKFISKSKRAQQPATNNLRDTTTEDEALRKEKADAMLQAQLEREAAARAAGRKDWDDEATAPEHEIDTSDEADPEGDKALWKLRELKRIRRERLAIEDAEREREEIERRRNMTAEEREEEDRKFLESQAEDREGKGKMAYMQKYFHKGAFFGDAGEQDEEVKAVLQRDLAGARFEDEADKSVLPEYMRIRDMTRLGRKGRTKYKDLKEEDTGRWGADGGRKGKGGGDRDLDERFRADEYGGGRERTGANSAPVGERRRREDDGGGTQRDEKRTRYA